MEEKKKKKGIRNIISNIILVIAIGVFLYSGYQLYTILADYHEGVKEYDQIRAAVITETFREIESKEDEVEQETVFTVNFEELLAINDDVVGWIRFDEPADISYPIAHGRTNKQYLRTTLEGKYNTAGTIFVDYRNSGDFSDKNTLIYGHNMRNGTMFGQLKKYQEEDFYEDYPYFYIYTPDGEMTTYQIFAVCVVLDTSDSYDISYKDEAEFGDYLDYIRSVALFQTDVEVEASSRIVSLSTCWNRTEDYRLLIHAVELADDVADDATEDIVEE